MIRPLHDYVFAKRLESSTDRTAGGLFIPEGAKEKPQEAEIFAVGPGTKDSKGKYIPLTVKVGDHVLFGKWSGADIKIEGETYLIMREAEILGVIHAK